MARFQCERNLQSLARCVGSTCHDALLVPGVWDLSWRAPRGVGHPETHPRTRGAVGYAEYSSRTLAPGLQLCKECKDAALRRTLVGVHQRSRLQHARVQPLAHQSEYSSITDSLLDNLPQMAPVQVVEKSTDIGIHDPANTLCPAPLASLMPCIMGMTSWPKALRAVVEVLLVDRFQHHGHRSLDNLLLERRLPDRTLPPVVLLNPDTRDGRCLRAATA